MSTALGERNKTFSVKGVRGRIQEDATPGYERILDELNLLPCSAVDSWCLVVSNISAINLVLVKTLDIKLGGRRTKGEMGYASLLPDSCCCSFSPNKCLWVV